MQIEGEEPRRSVRMSPGPWWGFNGVDRLELRPGLLVHSHFILFHGYLSRVHELEQVEIVSVGEVRRGSKRVLKLRLRLNGRVRLFTGWAHDAAPFVEALVTQLRRV
ncbi:hypothetical protein AS850_14095 [Frondihabitans sp. 762G35]|uniref:hypothetical protein n=1 Tax=Frondihabitans sp. 762G35 TaxID=1446794 RepID=UPI000D22113C|nr:hypothetical protein [Frondihabitans sp. 762G35]ARC58212.1 hypothetical protein AS850_14095 [Frondihabitans sp. 762G35]